MMYEFETHDAPSGGTLEVEALSATKVFLVAKQWVGSTTLEFAFAIATENGEVTPLSDWAASATVTARIPTTADLAENVIVFVLRVRDSFGSVTTVSESVVIATTQAPMVFDTPTSLFDMAYELTVTGVCPTDLAKEIQRVAKLTVKTASQIDLQQKLLLFFSACPDRSDNTDAKFFIVDQISTGLTNEDGTVKFLDRVEAARMVTVLSEIVTSSSHPSDALAQKSIELAMSVAASLVAGAVEGEVHTVITEAVTVNCSRSNGVAPVEAGGAAFAFAAPSSLRGGDVEIMGARWHTSPVAIVENVTSDLVSFTVRFADGNTTLPSPVLITIPLSGNTSAPSCVYFNFSKKDFDTDGCKVYNVTASSVVCACTHLTDFAIKDLHLVLPRKPVANKIDWGNFADTKVGAATVLAGISAAFGFFIFICRGWQEKQRKTFEELEKVRRLYVCRLFLTEVPKRKSDIAWTSLTCVARGVICRASQYDPREDNPFTRRRLLDSLKKRHQWLSVFFVDEHSNHTLPQRACSLAVYVMLALFFTGLFFKTSADSYEDLASSIFYTVVVTEVSILVVGRILHFFFVKIREGTACGVMPRGKEEIVATNPPQHSLPFRSPRHRGHWHEDDDGRLDVVWDPGFSARPSLYEEGA